MPAPYSDNLYSNDYHTSDEESPVHNSHGPAQHEEHADDSHLEEHALSPTDGYFHAAQSQFPNPLYSSSSSSGVGGSGGPQRTPFVPNVLVEDPTLRNSNDKAREAEEERLNNQTSTADTPHVVSAPSASTASRYTPTSSQAPSSPAHYHRRSVEEDTPLRFGSGQPPSQTYTTPSPVTHSPRPSAFSRDHGDAPPAYSPSPNSPTGEPQGGYQTFGQTASSAAMGSSGERALLLPREPQSMGGAHDGPSDTRWQRFKRFIAGSDARKKLKTILGILVVISIFLMVFGSFSLYPPSGHKDLDLGRDMPEKKPTSGSSPDFRWDPSPRCLDKAHSFPMVTRTFVPNPSEDLELFQTIAKDVDGHVTTPNIKGEVFLRASEDDSKGTLEVQVFSNSELEVSYETRGNSFKIITPRAVGWSSDVRPCLQIRATMWVPKNAKVKSFKVNTVQLDVVVTDGFSIQTVDTTDLGAVSGDVILPRSQNGESDIPSLYQLGSRDTYIHTTSGDVSGKLALYDSLTIATTSGDVTSYIVPMEADKSDPKPARLTIGTLSGTIKVKETITDNASIPARDFRVKIKSTSGDISALLAISSEADVHSTSGDLNLKLWPVLDSRELEEGSGKPTLRTSTASGDQTLDLQDPVWTSIPKKDLQAGPGRGRGQHSAPPASDDDGEDHPPILIIHPHDTLPISPAAAATAQGGGEDDGPYLEHYSSRHVSISGGIRLRYPSAWVGTIHASTISGSQKVRGEGLELSTKRREVTGRKGKGHSLIDLETVSGNQNVLIGKE